MTEKEYLLFLCHEMRDFLTPEQIAEYKQMHKRIRTLREGDRIKSILLLRGIVMKK